MSQSLPGTILNDTPEIVWWGVDSPDQVKVLLTGGQPPATVDWMQTRQTADGLRSRVFMKYVLPTDGPQPFDVIVTVPNKRTVHVSLRDGNTEYAHSVDVADAGTRGVLHFAKQAGGWKVSASSVGAAVDGSPRVIDNQPLAQRLALVPSTSQAAVSALMDHFPELAGDISKVDLVIDGSASMCRILASQELDSWVELGWDLGWAAAATNKSGWLVGQVATQLAIHGDDAPADFASAVRSAIAAGMATELPGLLAATLRTTEKGRITVCLTDAPPVDATALSDLSVEGSFCLLVVAVSDSAAAQRVEKERWTNTRGLPRFAMIPWDSERSLLETVLAGPGFGAAGAARRKG